MEISFEGYSGFPLRIKLISSGLCWSTLDGGDAAGPDSYRIVNLDSIKYVKFHQGGQSGLRKLDPRRTLIVGHSEGEFTWRTRLYLDTARYEALDRGCEHIVAWFQTHLDSRAQPQQRLPSFDDRDGGAPTGLPLARPFQSAQEAAVRGYLDVLGEEADPKSLPSRESCLDVLHFGWDMAETFTCEGGLTVGEYGAGITLPAPAGKWWAAMRYDEHITFPDSSDWKYGYMGILVVARDHGTSTLSPERLKRILTESNYVEGSEGYLSVNGATMWIVDSTYGMHLQESRPDFERVVGNGEPILEGRGARIGYEGDGRVRLFALLKDGVVDALVVL